MGRPGMDRLTGLGDGVGRLVRHQSHQMRQLRAHFAPVHDHIDGTLLQQEFRTLEAFR